MKNSRKISPKAISLVFGVLILCFSLSYWVLAWTEPTADPPSGNVDAPLNVGSTGQRKASWLSLWESACTDCSLYVGKDHPGTDYNGVIESSGGAFFGSALTAADNGLIVATGSVGIGETSPSYTLDVNGAAGANEICLAGDCRTVWPSGGGGTDDDWSINGNTMYATDTVELIGIGTGSPNKSIHVYGSEPTLLLSAISVNQSESGRLRFIEGTNWYGSYIRYDGATNVMHIGVHNTGDQNPANDNDVISIQRGDGHVGIGIAPNPDFDLRIGGNMNKTLIVGDLQLGTGGPTYKVVNVADPTNDSDVATKGYVDSQVSSGWAPTDVKASSVDHNGDFGGYNGIYNWIQSNGCSGYHVCSLSEIIAWAQLNNDPSVVNNTWFDSAVTYSSGDQSCDSYTLSGSDHAYIIDAPASAPTFKVGSKWVQNVCATNKKVACCK
jgi:hypothetical protein